MKMVPAVFFFLSFCASAAAHSSQHPSKPKAIQGSGCVEKAVETSCHVVIDSKSGNLYDLLFSAKAPKSGTAIWFKGTEHQGTTTCMQGKPVKVTKWKKEKGIKCPPPSTYKSAH